MSEPTSEQTTINSSEKKQRMMLAEIKPILATHRVVLDDDQCLDMINLCCNGQLAIELVQPARQRFSQQLGNLSNESLYILLFDIKGRLNPFNPNRTDKMIQTGGHNSASLYLKHHSSV